MNEKYSGELDTVKATEDGTKVLLEYFGPGANAGVVMHVGKNLFLGMLDLLVNTDQTKLALKCISEMRDALDAIGRSLVQ